MSGGLIAEWYTSDGAPVLRGDPVCRVECAFVAYEVEAEEAGLLRIRRPAGSIEEAGAVLAMILSPGEALPAHGADQREDGAASATDHSEQINRKAEAGGGSTAEPDRDLDDEPAEPVAPPEAVVVPFPRRFVQAAVEWEEAPGDAVEFRSSLFERAPEEPTAGLPEPGGSIPGLPLWEPEEGHASQTAPRGSAEERFGRISAEANAAAQILTVSIEVDMTEVLKLTGVCERSWRPEGVVARTEDAVFRSIALALTAAGAPAGTGALGIAEMDSEAWSAIRAAESRTLKEIAAARMAGGDTPVEGAEWLLVSLAPLGVASASPRLTAGMGAAFAMGGAGRDGVASVTMAYDSGRWSEGSAGRLMARIRELLEAPYTMLV